MQLGHVEWSPDGRSIIFGTLNCEVHIYDSSGNYLSQLPLYCLDDTCAATSIIGIDWYDGAEGVQEVVLDLRYNGGGLVSFANTLGNYLGGTRAAGQIFTSLLYTPSQAFKNATYRFANPAPADAVNAPRVIVLMGRRTCSASELVINGLRGAGLQVVGVGETSCGKPVGSVAGSNCGTTWSIVNFEGVNARGEGRYFDGIAATCPVAEDFSQPMASATDPLLKTALAYSDSGSCPQPTARAIPLYRRSTSDPAEPGERREMMP